MSLGRLNRLRFFAHAPRRLSPATRQVAGCEARQQSKKPPRKKKQTNMKTNDNQDSEIIPSPRSGENSLLRAAGITERAIGEGILEVHKRTAQDVDQIQEKQRGVLRRLFVERGLDQAILEAKIQQVKDFADFRRKILRVATDLKLELCHSTALAMSRELKIGNQERFTSLVLDKYESLRGTVGSQTERVLADIDAAFANAERYAHRPWLMDLAMKSLEQQTEQFFKWIDGLLDDYIAISKQRLDEYRKADSTPAQQTLESGARWIS